MSISLADILPTGIQLLEIPGDLAGGIVLGILFLGEVPSITTVIGVAITLVGIAGVLA